MKHVISVSIGSSKRDHSVEVELLGERVRIERRGTDGDLERARALIAELDGRVDAIGLGGLDLYIYAGGRRYTFRDAKKLARAAVRTPVVDGSGLKNSLERRVIQSLRSDEGISFKGKRVLMVAAVDRFGMAEELAASGAEMTFGDLVFGLGLPFPMHSLDTLARVARVVAPIVVRLPFKMLYPTGEKQNSTTPRHAKYFHEASVVAGDFHFIRRYMPERMDGKIIVTNTVTAADIEELRRRGVACLVTTTPDLGGRSFGTNVIEAALIAVSGKRPEELDRSDYLALIEEASLRPRIEWFADRTQLAAIQGRN